MSESPSMFRVTPILSVLLLPLTVHGGAAPAVDPWDRWAVDLEVASLWQAGTSTDINYLLLPVMISLRSPAHIRLDFDDGSLLTVRARASLQLTSIVRGPESLYAALSFSPVAEYWTSRRWCFYVTAGGGAGVIDSRGVPGGQGQDFTWNWFAGAGARWCFSETGSCHAGVMFQHMSNRGATDPNPGIDAVGPVLGLSWSF